MSANFIPLTDSRSITRLFGIAIIPTILLVSGCSTLGSGDEASMTKSPVISDASSSILAEARSHEYEPRHAIDKDMVDWEKARAAYLRDLDYENIEQQNNNHNEYLLKSYLVESRYHIKNAEYATVMEQDYQKALAEMRQAEQRYKQATIAANSAELDKLEVTEPNLDGLLKNAVQNMKNGCWHPQFFIYKVIICFKI